MYSQYFKVSVVICTYNGSKYLQQQIASILNQDTTPNEIVICDDASTDETINLLDLFSRIDKCSVRVVRNDKNIGYTKNFEQAISLANGDIIFFSDQDDVWFGNKIGLVCNIFAQNPSIAGVTHDGRLVDQDLTWHGTSKSIQIINGYGANQREITGALSAIHRSFLAIFFPVPNGSVGHDKWLTYIFSFFHERWFHSDLILQDIRRHSRNTSDWIANSFKPINGLNVLISQASTDVALRYSNRRVLNEALTSRLIGNSSLSKVFTSNEIGYALCNLRKELDAINERESIVCRKSKLGRSVASLLFWAKGGYAFFNGIKSLARDLLR